MVLPILCAGTLLAADYGLRSLARRGKLERALLGGRIRLELLENPGMAGGVLKNHPHLTAESIYALGFEYTFSLKIYIAPGRLFQKVQAAEKCTLAGTGRTDDT